MKNFFLIILIFFNISIFAQIELIQAAAEAGAESPEIAGECCTACSDPIFIESLGMIFNSLMSHHENVINGSLNKKIISFDISTNIAFDGDRQINLLPEVSINHGVFSTNFRMNEIREFKVDSVLSYKTYSWQILKINLYPEDFFIFSFASGFLFDNFTQKYYNEHFASIEIIAPNEYFFINLSGRYCNSYKSEGLREVYKEANLKVNFKIIDLENFWVHLTLGGFYQSYYGEVDINSYQAGLNFNFH